MPHEAHRVQAYLLAQGYMMGLDGKPIYSWPYRVHFTPGYKPGDFCLSSGDARNGNGSFMSAATALETQWRGDLESAGALWLVPLLERMAGGEEVPASEVFAAYKKVHGKKPRLEEWQVF